MNLNMNLRRFSSHAHNDTIKETVVSAGKMIKFHFSTFIEDGTLVESTRKGVPLSVVIGHGRLIRGLESGLLGKPVGEHSIFCPTIDAYGKRRKNKFIRAPLTSLPRLSKVGENLLLDNGESAVIAEIREEEGQAVLDLNHPLSGKDILFQVSLFDILDTRQVKVETSVKGNGIDFPTPGDVVTIDFIGMIHSTKQVFDQQTDFNFEVGIHEYALGGLAYGVSQMSLGEQATIFVPSEHLHGNLLLENKPDLEFSVTIKKISG